MRPDYSQLDWIDDFVDRIRPHVFVRQTDQVLIRMPNEAFKLNSTGARLLDHLLRGGSIKEVLKARSFDGGLPEQLHFFFNDLSRMLDSSFCEHYRSPSLKRVLADHIRNQSSNPSDQDAWIEYDLAFSSLEEARDRLLDFGGSVRVIEPAPLRMSLLDYAQEIVLLYQSN